MKTSIKLIAATACIMITSGCAANIKSVNITDIAPAATRIGYVSATPGYCPKEAFACDFQLHSTEIDAFQKTSKLDLVLLESSELDERNAANAGLYIAGWAIALVNQGAAIGISQNPLGVGSRIQNKLVIYNNGKTSEYECDGVSACRTEAARLMSKSTPAPAGEQFSKAAQDRLEMLKVAEIERRKQNKIAMLTKDIEYNKSVIKSLSDPELKVTEYTDKLKTDAAEKIKTDTVELTALQN